MRFLDFGYSATLVLATHDSRAVLALGERLRCHVLPRIAQETQR